MGNDPLDDMVRELLRYEKDGSIYWKSHPTRPSFVGRQALTAKSSNGYLGGKFRGYRLQAHRVVFFLHYGYWPKEVDHLNGVKTDNRPDNLIPSCPDRNKKNRARHKTNSSGVNGVSKTRKGKYKARVMVNRKYIHLGVFDTLEEAEKCRLKANKQYGFSERHGKEQEYV
jgi:hypothetical protein